MKKVSGTPVLTDEQTFQTALDTLTENIPFEEQGKCNAETVFSILLRAASQADSIENTCKTLQDVPCGSTIRNALGQYESVAESEDATNRALQDHLPPRIRKGKQRIAADYNLLPYYGKPSAQEEPYICRSKADSGTCSFFVYATLYVIKKGKRVTVAIVCVRKDDTYVCVLTRLFDKISHLNLRIKCLYADKGFFTIAVIRWLKTLDIAFVIPVIIRGKNGGTRQLIKEKRTRTTTYTMNSSEYGSVTFDVCVVCVYSKGKYGKNGTEVFAYAVHRVTARPHQVYKDYRKRFGIETSYRMKNICRIKTTVKNPAIRCLFIAISFIIVNLWVYILWKHISYPRKGGRLIFQEVFPLKQMLSFLAMAIDQKYKPFNIIYL
jgi:putative transposase